MSGKMVGAGREAAAPTAGAEPVARHRPCVALLKAMLPRLGLRWAGYRRVHRTVCKRIQRRRRSLGLGSLDAYREQLERDPGERAVLDALCRIPISRFGRDRAVFDHLGGRVLPALAARAREEGRDVRAWSCGCASGEEVYTLRLLRALAARPGDRRLVIVATDAEAHLLERASAACFPRGTLRELPAAWIERGFERTGDLFCVRPELRRDVAFLCQDVRETAPEGAFDLILCRNLAFTYFATEVQRRVLAALLERLRPGGCLVIGRGERLPPDGGSLVAEAPAMPVFRRPGQPGLRT